MLLSVTMLSMLLSGVSGWATCNFPAVDWMVHDAGLGKSATQKVAGVGTNAYIAGYAGGNTTLLSSAAGTSVVESSVTVQGVGEATAMDLHLSKIGDDGAISNVWIFPGGGTLGSSPGWSVLHGFQSDANALALGLTIKGNMSFPDGMYTGNDYPYIVASEHVSANGVGTVIKFTTDNDKILWYKVFPSSAGSNIIGVDGDGAGNMYVSYNKCVPCTDPAACVPETSYGQPTGNLLPTCVGHLAKLATADGTEEWMTELPTGVMGANTVDPGHIRLQRTGDSNAATLLYMWTNVKGSATISSINIQSAQSGAESSAVLMQFNAATGAMTRADLPGGTANVFSASYFDLQPVASSPGLVVVGGFQGVQTFGASTLTAIYGDYTSYVARLNPADGSVMWADVIPMQRGVQITPDGTKVNVFAQTQSNTDFVNLTDSSGAMTTLRSRGSWDLIAIEYNAADGVGEYAIDGGGNSMEYFHGFGMNSEGDMLISGYSRSSSFHFGDKSMANVGNDGLNKLLTVQVNHAPSPPSCVTGCGPPAVVESGKCFIDQYCYSNNEFAPYAAHKCYQCVAATSQTEWTGPNLAAHCYIDGVCYSDGEMKPGVGYAPASTCQMCSVADSTSAWTIKALHDFVDGSCIAMATVTPTMTALVTTAMSASTAVTTINGESGFPAKKTAYVGSVLQNIAKTGPRSTGWEGSDFTLFSTYFGSATYLDDYILSALDATGQFAGELAPTSRGSMVDARTEAVKKGLQDQILVMAMISVLQGSNSVESWDLAYAFWYGESSGSGAPYARANKRCKNYGTCAADGTTAKANFKVMQAIADGKAAALESPPNTAAATAAFEALRAAAYGVYYQASLRYAHFLDNDVADALASADHQGEGGAFWRVIAPLMNAVDADLTAYVTNFYQMTTVPGASERYCPLLYLLENNFLTGYTSTDFGTLENTGSITCMAGIQLPGSPSAAITAAMAGSALVKTITGSEGMGTSFAAAKTLYLGSALQTIATTSKTTAYASSAETYFGSATFLDDYILSAFDATGQFAGELAPTSRGSMVDARTEAVKKCLQDQILVTAALNALQDSAVQFEQRWTIFYAYWTGSDPGGAPWARANKRCKNYGTCGGGTSGANGEKAIVNSKILIKVLNRLHLTDGTNEQYASLTTEVRDLALLVYYQASLRYSFKMDTAIGSNLATADYQGEGGAFWRVIEPVMFGLAPAASKAVTHFYTMTSVPSGTNHYCPLKAMLEANLPSTLTVADMGTLEDTSAVVCATVPTADMEGAQVTTIEITAPGAVSDYNNNTIAGAAAAELNVYPAQVTVTITAANRLRGRSLQSGVIISISVVTADATAAASMETAMTTMAGSAASASTFLSSATGRSITVTVEPSQPSSGNADGSSSGGLSGGAIAGIVIGSVAGVCCIGGLIFFMMKKKGGSSTKSSTSV